MEKKYDSYENVFLHGIVCGIHLSKSQWNKMVGNEIFTRMKMFFMIRQSTDIDRITTKLQSKIYMVQLKTNKLINFASKFITNSQTKSNIIHSIFWFKMYEKVIFLWIEETINWLFHIRALTLPEHETCELYQIQFHGPWNISLKSVAIFKIIFLCFELNIVFMCYISSGIVQFTQARIEFGSFYSVWTANLTNERPPLSSPWKC